MNLLIQVDSFKGGDEIDLVVSDWFCVFFFYLFINTPLFGEINIPLVFAACGTVEL